MAMIQKPPLSKEQVQKIIDEHLASIIEKEIAQEKTNKNKSLKNYMVCLKFDGFRGGHEILWAEILFTPVDKEFEDKKSQLLQKLKNN